MRVTPFECYSTYLALKTHFSSPSYDYHRYGGKMNVKEDTFEVRKDKYFFMKLSKKPEPFEYLLANISSRGTKAWIGDIIDSSGEETYLAWKKRKESLSYNFKSELSNLKDELDDNLVMDGGNHPYLLRLYLLKEFSLDSLCIMNAVLNFVPYWDKNISEYDPTWKETKLLIQKYTPFLEIDKAKMKEIIESKFDYK